MECRGTSGIMDLFFKFGSLKIPSEISSEIHISSESGASYSILSNQESGITFRKTGSEIVRIPVAEFRDEKAVEAVRAFFWAIEKAKELDKVNKLRVESKDIAKSCEGERLLIQAALWMRFPEFVGSKIEIANTEKGFRLVVNGEERETDVHSEFAAQIIARQEELEKNENNAIQKRVDADRFAREGNAYRAILSQFEQSAAHFMRKALPAGDEFFSFDVQGENGNRQPVIAIHRKVNETLSELPAEAKRLFADLHAQGKIELSDEVIEKLGIGKAVKAIRKAIKDYDKALESI